MSDRPGFNIEEEIARVDRALNLRGSAYPVDTESAPPASADDITIPDYLRPRPNGKPGWFFSLKDGIFQDYTRRNHYPDDPMRADEERWAKTHKGCGNGWSLD